MSRKPDLGDPSFEPTDEQLADLMAGAFADVMANRERNDRRMRERIAAGRAAAGQQLAAILASNG